MTVFPLFSTVLRCSRWKWNIPNNELRIASWIRELAEVINCVEILRFYSSTAASNARYISFISYIDYFMLFICNSCRGYFTLFIIHVIYLRLLLCLIFRVSFPALNLILFTILSIDFENHNNVLRKVILSSSFIPYTILMKRKSE